MTRDAHRNSTAAHFQIVVADDFEKRGEGSGQELEMERMGGIELLLCELALEHQTLLQRVGQMHESRGVIKIG